MSNIERNINKRKGGITKSAIARRVIADLSGKATLHEMGDAVSILARIKCKYLSRRYVIRYANQEGSGIKILSKDEARQLRKG